MVHSGDTAHERCRGRGIPKVRRGRVDLGGIVYSLGRISARMAEYLPAATIIPRQLQAHQQSLTALLRCSMVWAVRNARNCGHFRLEAVVRGWGLVGHETELQSGDLLRGDDPTASASSRRQRPHCMSAATQEQRQRSRAGFFRRARERPQAYLLVDPC